MTGMQLPSAGTRNPPFARPIVDARARGFVPDQEAVRVLLDRWPPSPRPAQVWVPSVVIPLGDDPTTLRWDFLEGLDAFLMVDRAVSEPARVRVTITALLDASPRRLAVFDETGRAFWVKSVSHGVEVPL